MLERALSLPGTLASLSANISNIEMLATISKGAAPAAIAMGILDTLITICIIAIGALIVKYLTEGKIHNNTFNGCCIATVLLLVVSLVASIHGLIIGKTVDLVLIVLNDYF